jgi:hypothetical protein
MKIGESFASKDKERQGAVAEWKTSFMTAFIVQSLILKLPNKSAATAQLFWCP